MSVRRLGRLVWAWAGLLILVSVAARAEDGARETVRLADLVEPGLGTRVTVTLEAQGSYRPGEGTEEQPVSPLSMSVRTRLEFLDRVLEVGPEGRGRRSVRLVRSGEVKIDGEGPIRPMTLTIRPEVDRLVAELVDGDAVVARPDGPLTRDELELVQGPADPLELPALLPGKAVAVGDSWPLSDEAARALSGYDAIASNRLSATLREVDDQAAEIVLAGQVAGAVLGAEGTIEMTGSMRFDRQAHRIASLRLERVERRAPGPVEAGLEFQSTLQIDRAQVPCPPELTGEALPTVPDRLPESWLLLSYTDPSNRYRIEHDRAWYVFTEDQRQTVLRRLDGGNVVAQCNLVAGPKVEPGAHPKPDRFRRDVKTALGDRFERFLDAGQIDAPPGETRFRLAIRGHQGDEPIVWYYMMLSSPRGQQLVAIFTLRQAEAKRFGSRDLQMIGSLQWLDSEGEDSGLGSTPEPESGSSAGQ